MAGASRPNGGVENAATRRNSHAFASRFSLIELIVVAVILAILGGIGAAAYSTSKTKRGTIAATSRMTGAIALARQTAISENKRVALLFPVGTAFYSADYQTRLPQSWTGGQPGVAVRICEIDGNGQFADWLPGHGWIVLPERSYFNLEGNLSWTVTVPTTTVGSGTCEAIGFLPNGTLPEPGTLTVNVRPFPESGTTTLFKITVNWLTGLTETTKVGE